MKNKPLVSEPATLQPSNPQPAVPRLASLDALRGFDMFFITGGAAAIAGACAATGCCPWLAQQMRHVPWAGLAHHDTIFPLFLFLAGVTWPFSLASQEAKGASALQIHIRIFRRVAGLFLLGLTFGGFLAFKPTFRLMSVLGFIGLSWGGAALVFLHVKRFWGRMAVFASLVLGYFALLHFGVFPGAPAGVDNYAKEWNIIRYLDTLVYPEHMMIAVSEGTAKGIVPYEPESLFSVPSGVTLAMLGMFAGTLLRAALAPARKALCLLLAGLGSLALDAIFICLVGVPVIKALWTTSFIFAAAGYSFLMLALFYWIVDVRGWKKWTVLFDPVGKNSILVYFMMMIGISAALNKYLLTGLGAWAGAWGPVVRNLGGYFIGWAILRYCQKKDIFLRL